MPGWDWAHAQDDVNPHILRMDEGTFSLDVALIINEPAHDKIYNKTYATSKDSDQPAHPRSLIRIFADRMCLL